VEHEGQHAAHRRFWREWDTLPTSRKDFNFVISEHTIAVFWKPLAFFWTTEVVLRSALMRTRTLGVTEDARKRSVRIARECSGDLLPPSPPAEKATASQGDPAAAAHSMRASAQVTAPGAATNILVAVSTRPNRQNRNTCSRMSLSTKAKVEGGKSVTRPAAPKPTSWPLRWSTPSRRQIRTQLVLVSVPCSPPGYPVGNPSSGLVCRTLERLIGEEV
jgi:hypothetical protein